MRVAAAAATAAAAAATAADTVLLDFCVYLALPIVERRLLEAKLFQSRGDRLAIKKLWCKIGCSLA